LTYWKASIYFDFLAVCALSRIGKRYPHLQQVILPVMSQLSKVNILSLIDSISILFVTTKILDIIILIYKKKIILQTHQKESVTHAIIIGYGRLAKSNPSLRTQLLPEWISNCYNKNNHLRLAAIRALGKACHSFGGT
jgi:hypothetical protein